MNAKVHVARTIATSFIFALVITFFLKPKIQLSVFADLAIVLAIEVVGFLISAWLTSNKYGRPLVQILLLSFLLAAFIVFLVPAAGIGFDALFLIVTSIEVAGLVFGYVLAR